MLSSTYHFWGVHNLYQAKLANSILESKVKLVCFSFSFFAFHYSLFIFHYSILLFVFHFWFFSFCIRFSLFVSHFTFFDIQNRAEYCILTLDLRQNIVFLHLKSYFGIRTGAE